jgi:hypothetical protein
MGYGQWFMMQEHGLRHACGAYEVHVPTVLMLCRAALQNILAKSKRELGGPDFWEH